MNKLAVVILAAGQGTRMKSKLPKVLHPIAGQPMVKYVLNAVMGLGEEKPVLVVGYGADLVRQTLGDAVTYVFQEQQLGTGHAVLQTREQLEGRAEAVLVLYGDMPLLSGTTLHTLVRAHETRSTPITMLTCVHEESMGFGRILRDAKGRVIGIVEESQATPEQLAIQELNPGVYCFEAAWLWAHLPRLPRSPKGEYYLTDLVGMAVAEGHAVEAIQVEDPLETLGVNDRLHLAKVEEVVRQRIRENWMRAGVTLVNPSSIYIDATVQMGQDTVIYPNTYLQGTTRIGSNCLVGPNTIIRDSTIGNDCRLEASVIEGAIVENQVSIGPFAHLRPGAHLAEGVHMGNFGEVKASYLGPGVKMGHFSYIGDATIGADVNIGAGTVTCNFDGIKKHRTVIEDGAFIGSDTMLVAPVRIGARARIGAGSVVTRDIPPDSTAYGVPARVKPKMGSGTEAASDADPSPHQTNKEKNVEDKELIALAIEARQKAYAPYSHYRVGAALLTASGKVYTGCNVENVSYGLTVCAERVAALKAVCDGEREFVAIAVVTENGGAPCGACRQVLAEFGPEMRVLATDVSGNHKVYTLRELLPVPFRPSHLLGDESGEPLD
ncbi:MAG: bifunctional UDP-N-acetylglucosamine diphosphorylase/glucosamine-1-phosphate N-acetyltransferase GlmU [Chloroflexi bacterium]|nr:bifunctional UDP-N-acetylglucosamine diphosphorylase/glucosamine-1-phosphate N-acetyltransferase GlmU [Chloroflexota bacterium]